MTATDEIARLTRLTQYFAARVTAGDLVAQPSPQRMAAMTPKALRAYLAALLTVRMPAPMDDEVEHELDELLETESRERATKAGCPDALTMPTLATTHGVSGRFGAQAALWRGDLSTLRAGAVVNAANSALLGCLVPGHRCIDHVLHAVAGPGLRAECARYMETRGGRPEETGRALLTGGYHLPAAHVIHTVGPIVTHGLTDEHRRLLASCYRSILDVAEAAELDSVGLCSVSTGVFGYPKADAAALVLDTINQWLGAHPASELRIVICAFAQTDVDVYEAALECGQLA